MQELLSLVIQYNLADVEKSLEKVIVIKFNHVFILNVATLNNSLKGTDTEFFVFITWMMVKCYFNSDTDSHRFLLGTEDALWKVEITNEGNKATCQMTKLEPKRTFQVKVLKNEHLVVVSSKSNFCHLIHSLQSFN